MTILKANKIELFKNLAQFEFGQVYYDFHNDFNCARISFIDNCIELLLKHTVNNEEVFLKFLDAEIIKLNFGFNNEKGGLTIDNLHRGRFEVEGDLHEFNSNQKSFYYLEFYEGQTIEFFCEAIVLVKESDNK